MINFNIVINSFLVHFEKINCFIVIHLQFFVVLYKKDTLYLNIYFTAIILYKVKQILLFPGYTHNTTIVTGYDHNNFEEVCLGFIVR